VNRNDVAVEVAKHPAVRTNFFERPQPREYEVGIVEDGGSYWVYWSSERASIRAERSFSAEADALAEFLDLLDLEQQRHELFGGR
jgi:hypothetical protein